MLHGREPMLVELTEAFPEMSFDVAGDLIAEEIGEEAAFTALQQLGVLPPAIGRRHARAATTLAPAPARDHPALDRNP